MINRILCGACAALAIAFVPCTPAVATEGGGSVYANGVENLMSGAFVG